MRAGVTMDSSPVDSAKTPRVSVTMVVCNVERYLPEAIESILNQTFRDFEFIIVDFGSTDGTPGIVSRYAANDPRIRMHAVPPCGLGEARNESCALARSPLIATMDADDVALKDRLMLQVEYMDRYPEIGVLGGAVEIIDGAGKKLGVRRCPLQNAEIQSALLLDRPSFVNPTLMMRTELFHKVGGYRPAFAPAEDFELWLRMAEKAELANLDAYLLNYRVHPKQESYRRMYKMTISGFAAKAGAKARRSGSPDPLASIDEVTPEFLAQLGIKPEDIENTLLLGYQEQIKVSIDLHYDVPLLESVGEMLSRLRNSKYARKDVAAEVWFAAARAYWSGHQYFRAGTALARALVSNPSLFSSLVGRGLRRFTRVKPSTVGVPQNAA
jgi:glycosyltransferase involved in cell wall biosynthesis